MRNAKPQNSIKDLPLVSRPRERLQNMGVEGLTTIELVAILLGSGTSQNSVLQTAQNLIKKFSLQNLKNASLQKLTCIPGLGTVGAGKILAALELGKRSLEPPPLAKLNSPQSVLQVVKPIRHKKREYALALYLNGRQELIHKQTISIGGVNFNYLEARDIFSPALSLPSPSLILVHNHPSGNPTASEADHRVTHRLSQAGKLLGIELTDHIIVTQNNYFSFREAGILSPNSLRE